MLKLAALLLLAGAVSVHGLNNGLALTPPMGWMAWQTLRCETNCTKSPQYCVSEKNLKEMADALYSGGYAAVGYNSIHIDDCYLAKQRNAQGNLYADPARFPSGMKALGDYLHSLNLGWAIYEDIGILTCGGYPGIEGHMQNDANTFASWGADYLKLDGCYGNGTYYQTAYPAVAGYLNETGRKIVYSCSWPAYLSEAEKVKWYPTIQKYCNLWRNYGDISDSWDAVVSIAEYWGDNGPILAKYAAPGSWNDPDMLIIGGYALSPDESEFQMGLWSIVAAPLIMGNDVRNLKDWQRDILQNVEVIAVDQDPLGIQGQRLTSKGTFEVWARPLVNNSLAVALVNKCSSCGYPQNVQATWQLLNITGSYACRDLFSHTNLGIFNSEITLPVNEHGIRLLRCNPTA